MRNTSHKSNKNGGNDVYMGAEFGSKIYNFFWKYSEIFFIYKKKRKAAGAFFLCNNGV